MEDDFISSYLNTKSNRPQQNQRGRQPLRRPSTSRNQSQKNELLDLISGQPKLVLKPQPHKPQPRVLQKSDLIDDFDLDSILQLSNSRPQQSKQQFKKPPSPPTDKPSTIPSPAPVPAPVPQLELNIIGSRRGGKSMLGEKRPPSPSVSQVKHQQTMHDPPNAQYRIQFEEQIAKLRKEKEDSERTSRADFQRQIKEERERHNAQIKRLEEMYTAQQEAAFSMQMKEAQLARTRFEELLKAQRQMYQNEIKVLQQHFGKIKEGKPTEPDRLSKETLQGLIKQLSSQRGSQNEQVKRRLEDDQRRVKQDRQQLRLQRQALLERENGLKKQLQQQREQLSKQFARSGQAQRRVYMQLLSVEEQRKRIVQERDRAREQLRRDQERHRQQCEAREKELSLQRQILEKERAGLAQQRKQFELARARLSEQTDALKRSLLIKEADYNSKLRVVDVRQSQATRLSAQLRQKLTVIELEKERYESQIRRIHMLTGQFHDSQTASDPRLRKEEEIAARVSRLDDYVGRAAQQADLPQARKPTVLQLFRQAGGVDLGFDSASNQASFNQQGYNYSAVSQPHDSGFGAGLQASSSIPRPSVNNFLPVPPSKQAKTKKRTQKIQNYIRRVTTAYENHTKNRQEENNMQKQPELQARKPAASKARGQSSSGPFLLIEQFMRERPSDQ